jgi:hypothetical protein
VICEQAAARRVATDRATTPTDHRVDRERNRIVVDLPGLAACETVGRAGQEDAAIRVVLTRPTDDARGPRLEQRHVE